MVLPHASLAEVRLLGHFLRERLAWCDAAGVPRGPREVLRLEELQRDLHLDRKSIHAALRSACEARYLEAVTLPAERGGGFGFRLKLDLERFTLKPDEFQGFYPMLTHRIKVPLEFFTVVVPEENLSVIKVVACVIRCTLGTVDNLGSDAVPSISQQHYARRMRMGRRQAIEGVRIALDKRYIQRHEQGSLASGKPSTYSLFWRRGAQALTYPREQEPLSVVAPAMALGKRDQAEWEKGIRRTGKRDQANGKKGSGDWEKGIRDSGKGDQGGGKKGSGGEFDTDLILDLDLDLDLRSSSSGAPPEFPAPSAAEKEAAEEFLLKEIRSLFPNGNPKLVRRFLDERGAPFLLELCANMRADDVDPAFVRRFTRSSDPRWAVFYTSCTAGRLPPRRPPPPSDRPSEARIVPPPDEEAAWAKLTAEERLAELLGLWRQARSLYLREEPSEGDEDAIRKRLTDGVARGAPRVALEQLVFEELERRRGRPLGATANGPG